MLHSIEPQITPLLHGCRAKNLSVQDFKDSEYFFVKLEMLSDQICAKRI